MQKQLNFICPTDHLETVIQESFQQENYFYTSLGNSVLLDAETVVEINKILESKNISKITLFLSRDNHLFLSALHNIKYTQFKGMQNFYGMIDYQIQQLNFNQKIKDIELQLITNYLNKKISELYQHLNSRLGKKITVNALIYNPQNNVFVEAETKLFRFEECSMN